HTRSKRDWSSDVCSSDLTRLVYAPVLSLALPSVPAAPTAEDVPGAHGKYSRLLVDFPFVSLAARTNTLALRLLPSCGPLLRRIRSEERRVGKGCSSACCP